MTNLLNQLSQWPIKCPLYWLTGYQCPLCGTQRAIWQFLHLNIKEAWTLNPGLFCLVPYLIIILIGQIFPRLQKENKVVAFCYHGKVIIAVLVYLAIWGIYRNI